MGKEQDVLYIRGIRNQHGQPVDADPAASGGRHAVLHGTQEVLVHGMGFPVAQALHFHLLFEPAALVHRVVQLRERVGEFTSADEQLEPFREIGVVRMPLRQGRYLHGIIGNEGRVHQVVLHEALEKPVDHLSPAQFGVHFEAPFAAYRREFPGRHPGDVDTGVLAYGIEHGQPRPWRGQIDGPVLVRMVQRAVDVLEDADEEALHEVHDVPVIDVGDIELQHGEFGIVRAIDPFVAEIVTDFVHALQAAHDETLQVEFVGYAHEQRHVEGLVMGLERPRKGATVQGLKYGRFDFDETLAVHETLDGPDKPRPFEEDFLDAGIDDQIDVALPVPGLDVPQAVPFFGQGTQGLRQQLELVRHDGGLAGPGGEDGAFDAQEVPYLDHLVVDFIHVRADAVEADVDLDPAGAVEQVGKARFAMAPLGSDPTRNRDRLGGFDQVFRLIENGLGGMGYVVADGVRIDAASAERFELAVPLPVEFVRAVHPFAPEDFLIGGDSLK